MANAFIKTTHKHALKWEQESGSWFLMLSGAMKMYRIIQDWSAAAGFPFSVKFKCMFAWERDELWEFEQSAEF